MNTNYLRNLHNHNRTVGGKELYYSVPPISTSTHVKKSLRFQKMVPT